MLFLKKIVSFFLRFSSCFIVLLPLPLLPLLPFNGSSSSSHYLLLFCHVFFFYNSYHLCHHLLLLLILLHFSSSSFFLLLSLSSYSSLFSPLHPSSDPLPLIFSPSLLLVSSSYSTPSPSPPLPPPGLKTRACSLIRRASLSGPWCWVTSRGRGQRLPTGWGRSVAMETVSPALFAW